MTLPLRAPWAVATTGNVSCCCKAFDFSARTPSRHNTFRYMPRPQNKQEYAPQSVSAFFYKQSIEENQCTVFPLFPDATPVRATVKNRLWQWLLQSYLTTSLRNSVTEPVQWQCCKRKINQHVYGSRHVTVGSGLMCYYQWRGVRCSFL
jgi:hypothetical protein